MPNELDRREFLLNGAKATMGLALLPLTPAGLDPATLGGPALRVDRSFDLVIRGGVLLDGTGGPPWRGDIGVVGDTIRSVGIIDPEQGSRVIDASGHHVSPGFIDIHSHSDGSILRYPEAESRVMQGVTTEITGNCGGSAAPRVPAEAGSDRERLAEELAEEYGIEGAWTDVASYFDVLEQVGISLNHLLLLGQGTLRGNVAESEDRALTEEEMAQVLQALEDGLDQGAFGLSTGLEYVPGRFTPTEEILAMARVVARRGGLYASHIRNEESMLLEAVDEAIQIGRRSGVRVQIAHLKAAGRPNWGKQVAALDLIEGARVGGVDVLADAYPYTAYSTGISIFLPAWAAGGGREALLERLGDASERSRIRNELGSRVLKDPGDFELIVISNVRSEENRWAIGKDMTQIAQTWGVDPVDALLRLMEEERSVSFIGHGMSQDNVDRVLSHPLVMIGSDGSSMAPRDEAAESRPHPRSYGTFARVLGHYCRDRGLFDLPTAVKKMTSMPADQLGLADRGRIARGMKADLVVFAVDEVKDLATFQDPHRYAQGIRHVMVNGELVVEGGVHTGHRPGAVLRRG
jgi:N-acyl-D-amino-acid deacylase